MREKREKLSEEEPTSDRFEGETRKAVRRRANFRQVREKNEKSCQKKSQLQTALRGKREKLSKEGPTSDRFEGETRKAVRRRANFRQV
ncbi:hypothetical protein [Mesobacillus jeotgali]|uniref:Uncharacterized protein n=1 Tax=Mesobacillus jeotgali TaxID=129985 RepID=A0ABY9VDT3_9BACI|nr:hypothetical protein [Mesobacillus jeotgali]WNF21965.1 hypothetical protein RH061_17490 [Mesobacillus jeotgali]